MTTTSIWTRLQKRTAYAADVRAVVGRTVDKLLAVDTTVQHPGMLLGKVQSGKTKTFIGVLAHGFDRGFEVAIVLTKGTTALAEQTLERLQREFRPETDEDLVVIQDIMALRANPTDYELEAKQVFVVKKQTDNLDRLANALLTDPAYGTLRDRRILIIDDEADFASVGFRRDTVKGVSPAKIASQIDGLRRQLPNAAFLQVTATPYSLYLQPADVVGPKGQSVFKPVRPAFTELVPIHADYVGGEFYFEEGEDPDTVAGCVFREVPEKELGVLKKPDGRVFKIADVLTSKAIQALRESIVTFIVGGCLRRLHERQEDKTKKPRKFSFIVHTEISKAAHGWQSMMVDQLVTALRDASVNDRPTFEALVAAAAADLAPSVGYAGLAMPSLTDLCHEVASTMKGVSVVKVNSEAEARTLLDDSGQLALRAPLSIFVGGNILDRGITIGNLIGFFYGRNPKTFQQDTVLQHARMYGFRPRGDLAVTRFHTTANIYGVLKRIHEIDAALRDAFEKGGHDAGVVFIQQDAKKRITACAPNKILLSSTTTLRPFKRLLPVGFQTGYKTHLAKPMAALDAAIAALAPKAGEAQPFLVDVAKLLPLIDDIDATYAEWEPGCEWDREAFKASLSHLAAITKDTANQGKAWVIVRRDRKNVRVRESGRLFNAPVTQHVEGKLARSVASHLPVVMLFRQTGAEEQGWKGSPFWWPVLLTPASTPTCIFASETSEEETDLAA